MYSFENTGALAVGAASGIGRAMALEMARRGARVMAADIDTAGARRTADLINEAGGHAAAVGCDVTDTASLSAAVVAAEDFLGAIDLSLNTAGVLLSGNPEDIPLPEWERIFQINLFGAVRLNERVLPGMMAREQGYIVNTASVAGLHPFAITRVPYAASKAALISMSENLAIYLKPRGVRVSCLCPGPTATPIGGRASSWTDGLPMIGPGRDYELLTSRRAAGIFCDGVEREQVIILSHESITLKYLQRWAATPDGAIAERVAQYAAGDNGLPEVDLSDPDILEAFRDS